MDGTDATRDEGMKLVHGYGHRIPSIHPARTCISAQLLVREREVTSASPMRGMLLSIGTTDPPWHICIVFLCSTLYRFYFSLLFPPQNARAIMFLIRQGAKS